MTIEIYVIDHRPEDRQPDGEIIHPFMLTAKERDSFYADFCALQYVWGCATPPDIIGFFGYRKYLYPNMTDHSSDWMTPAHAPNWWQCSKPAFDGYRELLATNNDGWPFKQLLAQCDILQAAPFPLQESICDDFARSRSKHDEKFLWEAACARWSKVHTVRRIYPYIFITRWSVFDRMMREIEPIRQELGLFTTAEDSTDEAYKKRPMAYVMERVYSLWLENSGLSIKEVPLLHCWEMQP